MHLRLKPVKVTMVYGRLKWTYAHAQNLSLLMCLSWLRVSLVHVHLLKVTVGVADAYPVLTSCQIILQPRHHSLQPKTMQS